MKQGTGKNLSGKKVEPKATTVSPATAAEIGLQQVKYRPNKTGKRGYEAPLPKSATTHRGGSQGRH